MVVGHRVRGVGRALYRMGRVPANPPFCGYNPVWGGLAGFWPQSNDVEAKYHFVVGSEM